jgi:hypothetical protein
MTNNNQDNILQINTHNNKMTDNILQMNTQDNKTADDILQINTQDNKMTNNNQDNILQPLQKLNDESNLLQTVFLGEKDTKFEEIIIANKYFDLTGQYIRPLKVMEEFYIFQFNFDYVEL